MIENVSLSNVATFDVKPVVLGPLGRVNFILGTNGTGDCHALLEVLQRPLPTSGKMAMQALLENARMTEIKVSALGSPFKSKDLLRERGYRWNAEKKVWAKDLPNQQVNEEAEWLKSAVYGGKGFRLEHEKMTAKNRYSDRSGPSEIPGPWRGNAEP